MSPYLILRNMIIRFILFLVLNFAALGVGGLYSEGGATSDWYNELNRAPWTPPGWVFGVAWTFIMLCFAVYMAFAWQYFEPETPRYTVLRTMDTEFRLVSRFLPLPHGKLGPYYHIGPYSPDRLFSFCSAFQAKGKDSLCTALFPVVAYRRLAQRLHLARELSFFCYCRYDLRRYESYRILMRIRAVIW